MIKNEILEGSPRYILRQAILEKGATFNEISLAIGKNATYIHQFLNGRSPKALRSDVREALGALLGISPDSLRDDSTGRSYVRVASLIRPTRPTETPVAPSPTTIPARYDTDNLSDKPRQEMECPPGMDAKNALAVWLTEPRSHFLAGDMLYLDTASPARIGDSIVIYTDDGAFAAVGTLAAFGTIEGVSGYRLADEARTISRAGHCARRIVWVRRG